MNERIEWWNNHQNLCDLYRWLDERGEMDDVGYFLSKPWKWEKERNAMLAEQGQESASTSVKDEWRNDDVVIGAWYEDTRGGFLPLRPVRGIRVRNWAQGHYEVVVQAMPDGESEQRIEDWRECHKLVIDVARIEAAKAAFAAYQASADRNVNTATEGT